MGDQVQDPLLKTSENSETDESNEDTGFYNIHHWDTSAEPESFEGYVMEFLEFGMETRVG